jgi:hypothetical protein
MKCECDSCKSARKRFWDINKAELLDECKVIASYGWPFKSIPVKENEKPKEGMIMLTIDDDSIAINNRVCTFTLSRDKKAVNLIENCDDFYDIDLSRKDLKQLIDKLTEFYNEMKDDSNEKR